MYILILVDVFFNCHVVVGSLLFISSLVFLILTTTTIIILFLLVYFWFEVISLNISYKLLLLQLFTFIVVILNEFLWKEQKIIHFSVSLYQFLLELIGRKHRDEEFGQLDLHLSITKEIEAK